MKPAPKLVLVQMCGENSMQPPWRILHVSKVKKLLPKHIQLGLSTDYSPLKTNDGKADRCTIDQKGIDRLRVDRNMKAISLCSGPGWNLPSRTHEAYRMNATVASITDPARMVPATFANASISGGSQTIRTIFFLEGACVCKYNMSGHEKERSASLNLVQCRACSCNRKHIISGRISTSLYFSDKWGIHCNSLSIFLKLHSAEFAYGTLKKIGVMAMCYEGFNHLSKYT